MDAKLLPFMYAALVFSVVAFLFILLGRIFLNVETIYFYEFDVVTTVDQDYLVKMEGIIKERGSNGWKYEGNQEMKIKGAESHVIVLIFMRSRNKIKFF